MDGDTSEPVRSRSSERPGMSRIIAGKVFKAGEWSMNARLLISALVCAALTIMAKDAKAQSTVAPPFLALVDLKTPGYTGGLSKSSREIADKIYQTMKVRASS